MEKAILSSIFLGGFLLYVNNINVLNAVPTGVSGKSGTFTSCDDCHTPENILNNAANAIITSDIPASGYIPGHIYKIMLTIKSQKNKVGFDLSIQNSLNQLVGEIDNVENGQITTAIDTEETGGIAGEVTHTVTNNTISNGEKIVSFDWTAPKAGTGIVNIWASVGTGIVYPYIDTLNKLKVSFNEDVSTSYDDNLDNELKIYPTIVRDRIFLEGLGLSKYNLIITLINTEGKICKTVNYKKGESKAEINCQDLPNGKYVLKAENNSAVKSIKIVIEN